MRTEYTQRTTTSAASTIYQHPLSVFTVLSIVWGWLPLLFSTILPYEPLMLLSAAAPLLAAFQMNASRRESVNVRALTQLPSGIQWYIGVMIPLLWGGALSGLNQLFPDGTIDYPVISNLLFAAALVFVFAKSEQIAWNGYVLPKLQANRSAFSATLIATALFCIIYLPFYVAGALVDRNVFPLSPAFMAGVILVYVGVWHHLHISRPLKQRGPVGTVLRSVGRGWLALGVAIVALLGTAYLYQSAVTNLDKGSFPPPGQIVTVNGHPMHILCTGQGSPTVILEAGAFSFSAEWYMLQKQLEQTNRVCSYDRAGNGWSEAVAGSRDGLTLVRELHALLRDANIPGPYVLAGHSLGGVLDVIYASQYPAEVLGIVMVDPAIPTKFVDRKSYEQFVSQNQSAYSVMAVLAKVGLIRPVVRGEFRAFGYPESVIPELTALKARVQGVDTWDAEVRLAQWDLYQQFQVAANLDKLPVVVLWASHPEITAPADRQRLRDIWALLPVTTSNEVIRIVEGATHGSIIGQPEYVAQINQAVQDVIHAASTENPLSK